ncbi:MAG TPA: PQQ-dependent sugar dehydrogenase [Nitrosopumilaceae archaeon]|nr:PQQ-dependent sugar dehydrogenase [Nitrosopumilaceae archaeon]
MKKFLIFIFALILSFGLTPNVFSATVQDPALKVEEYITGLDNPTTLTFIGSDILVLEKNVGKVRLIRDGILQDNPVLDVSVNNQGERGFLGIESVGNNVYLDFSESLEDGGSPIGNHIYKYTWDGTNLVNPVLLKEMPAEPAWFHTGGALAKDLDGNIYAVIGDVGHYGVLQNLPSGDPNDTGVIMRVDPEGPYYAMGVRNSFGITFDPKTGNMWDTENGELLYDEINLVPPNFNSGWNVMMGPASQEEIDSLPGYGNYVYSDPEFSWVDTISPTSILFIDSEELPNYSDNVLVGNCNLGTLYKFTLNPSRDSFVFSNPDLFDLVLDVGDDSSEIEFGSGFGCTTDIEQGPDGFLYVVSLTGGTIYRIVPTDDNGILSDNVLDQNDTALTIPEWIKNTAGWWAGDLISENEFLLAIEYLIENNIMKITTEKENLSKIPTYTLPSSGSIENVIITGDFPDDFVGLLNLNIIQPDGSEIKLSTIDRNGSIRTTMPLNSESPTGTYYVFAIVGDRTLLGDDANSIRLVYTFNVKEYENPDKSPKVVPEWIKNTAGWWSNDEIDDNSFVQGIKYLIEQGIITV